MWVNIGTEYRFAFKIFAALGHPLSYTRAVTKDQNRLPSLPSLPAATHEGSAHKTVANVGEP